MNALHLDAISHKFGSLPVLQPLTLTVAAGARHAIIGPNGAGKSTLLNIIAGCLTPTSGGIYLFGQQVTGQSVHRRAQLGIGRVFQQPHLSGRHTARGNVMLALARRHHLAARTRPLGRRTRNLLHTHAEQLLEEIGLGAVVHQLAGQLSHGQRRQLELAVTLAAGCALLLLDEPTAGLSSHETDKMVELLRALPPTVTLLIVEHDLQVLDAITTTATTLTPPSPGRPDRDGQR